MYIYLFTEHENIANNVILTEREDLSTILTLCVYT